MEGGWSPPSLKCLLPATVTPNRIRDFRIFHCFNLSISLIRIPRRSPAPSQINNTSSTIVAPVPNDWHCAHTAHHPSRRDHSGVDDKNRTRIRSPTPQPARTPRPRLLRLHVYIPPLRPLTFRLQRHMLPLQVYLQTKIAVSMCPCWWASRCQTADWDCLSADWENPFDDRESPPDSWENLPDDWENRPDDSDCSNPSRPRDRQTRTCSQFRMRHKNHNQIPLTDDLRQPPPPSPCYALTQGTRLCESPAPQRRPGSAAVPSAARFP